MSNFVVTNATASPAFDLSKFGPMTSINAGQAPGLTIDPSQIAWTLENFPAEGVTINGVTFKLAPIDLSKLEGLKFGNIQLFKSGDAFLSNGQGVTLQATSEPVWQIPTTEDGSIIELDFAGIDLAGIDLSGVTFHTFAF